jgi:myosin heavy subunit
MRYLTSVAGSVKNAGDAGRDVGSQILEANPLLEAFGNAKTLRNDNSSRFGKFIEIQFDTAGRIGGASITNYLLEKSRIVSQNEGERNYHIFYQLARGAGPEEKARLKLRPVEQYHYLNQSSCNTVEGLSDAEEYRHTVKAMEIVGFSKDDIAQVMRIVAGILALGNVDFVPTLADAAKVKDPRPLAEAAELLGVADASHLERVLLTRVVHVPGEGPITKPLTTAEAAHTRDAVSKSLYDRMFNQLVRRVNQSIRFPNAVRQTIGILDIFGFEIFQTNSFEQFCINYANEKLQSQFNDHVFKEEIREYEREGVPFDTSGVTYIDNTPCIDLIESRLGALALLDEECSLGQSGEDLKFLAKLLREQAKSAYLEKPRLNPRAFTVKHYAGDVTYDVLDFLDKNMDNLREDVVEVLATSKLDLVTFLYGGGGGGGGGVGSGSGSGAGSFGTPGRESTASSASSPAGRGSTAPASRAKKQQQPSVSFQFKGQLHSLVETLSAAHPHYVRCLKTNSIKKARVFDAPAVLHQLRCAGVLESIRIRRSGFPTRTSHEDFYKKYRVLMKGGHARAVPGGKKGGAVGPQVFASLAAELVASIGLSDDLARVGKTKVFLRMGLLAHLEQEKAKRLYNDARRIQTAFRRWSARTKYLALKRAALTLQKHTRGWIARKRFAAFVAKMRVKREAARKAEAERRRRAEEEERERKRKAEEEERERIRRAEEEERERIRRAEEEERARALEAERRRLEAIRLEEERLAEEERRRVAALRAAEAAERASMAAAEADCRRRFQAIDEAERLARMVEEARRLGEERAREAAERDRMYQEELEQRWVEAEKQRLALEKLHKQQAASLSLDASEAALRRRARLDEQRAAEARAMAYEDAVAGMLVEVRQAQNQERRVRRVLALTATRRAKAGDVNATRAGGASPSASASASPAYPTPLFASPGPSSSSFAAAAAAGAPAARARDPDTFSRRCRRLKDSVALLKARRSRKEAEARLAEIHHRNLQLIEAEAMVALAEDTEESFARRGHLFAMISPRRKAIVQSFANDVTRIPTSQGDISRAYITLEQLGGAAHGRGGGAVEDALDPLAFRYATGNMPKMAMRRRKALQQQQQSGRPRGLSTAATAGAEAVEMSSENGVAPMRPLNAVDMQMATVVDSPLKPLIPERQKVYDAALDADRRARDNVLSFTPAESGRRRVPEQDPVYSQAIVGAEQALDRSIRAGLRAGLTPGRTAREEQEALAWLQDQSHFGTASPDQRHGLLDASRARLNELESRARELEARKARVAAMELERASLTRKIEELKSASAR